MLGLVRRRGGLCRRCCTVDAWHHGSSSQCKAPPPPVVNAESWTVCWTYRAEYRSSRGNCAIRQYAAAVPCPLQLEPHGSTFTLPKAGTEERETGSRSTHNEGGLQVAFIHEPLSVCRLVAAWHLSQSNGDCSFCLLPPRPPHLAQPVVYVKTLHRCGIQERHQRSARHPRAAHAYMSPPPSHDTFIHSDAWRCMPGWVVFKLGAERWRSISRRAQRGPAWRRPGRCASGTANRPRDIPCSPRSPGLCLPVRCAV